MRKHLYLLCEGETDEIFYETLAERVTGMTFVPSPEFRYRPGANWKTVLATARLLLERLEYWTEKQDIAVIIAVDNDRKPERHQELRRLVEATLGADEARWPVDVALAVPVEMIESWLLLLLDPHRPKLPVYARASQPIAKKADPKGNPPPQLKDLVDADAKEPQATVAELFLQAAGEGDLQQLAARSPSYALFAADLGKWT